MPKKTYVQGKVDDEVVTKFITNAFLEYGPKQGYKGRALEEALKLFNNYFEKREDGKFIQKAREMGMEPWEFSRYIQDLVLQNQLCTGCHECDKPTHPPCAVAAKQ